MNITEERLSGIQERLEAATNGPWFSEEGALDGDSRRAPGFAVVTWEGAPITWDDHGGEVFTAEDAALIASAPSDLAFLATEVHRLRDELAYSVRVAVSEEMRLRRKKAALLIELDATYRKHGEAGIEQQHLDAARADLNAAQGGGDDA